MIRFSCPGCGHRYTVDDRFLGGKVRCAGCNQSYFIGVRGAGRADEDLPTVSVERLEASGTAVDVGYDCKDVKSCSDWNRLIARNLDFALAYWIIGVILGLLIAGTSWERRLASLPVWLDWMLSLPLYYLFEAGMYAWLHTTPGKWLMGVAIVDRNLRPLSSGDYFKRDLLVWLLGCGMGVPILSFFMACYQSQRLKKGKETDYDEKLGTRAIMKGQTFMKTMAGVLLLLLSAFGKVGLERL